MKSQHRLVQAVAVLVSLSAMGQAGGAAAQAFPVKPIRIVNPAAPGGNSEVFFRLLGPKMTAAIGQNFVMDCRPGARADRGTA